MGVAAGFGALTEGPPPDEPSVDMPNAKTIATVAAMKIGKMNSSRRARIIPRFLRKSSKPC